MKTELDLHLKFKRDTGYSICHIDSLRNPTSYPNKYVNFLEEEYLKLFKENEKNKALVEGYQEGY